MKNKPVFLTLFMELQNVHLVKDVGMIPYSVGKTGKYQTKLAGYMDREKFPYAESEVKGLEMVPVKRYTGKPTIDGSLFLLKNAKKIDVLQLYHITTVWNLIWILVYKFINSKGKVYLKLDTGYGRVEAKQTWWQMLMLKQCDMVSAELHEVAQLLSEKWGRTVTYIPNGCVMKKKGVISYESKQNIICTVGRIGTRQKATDVLLEVFRTALISEDWMLHIIGPIEETFYEYMNVFFEQNPSLKSRILFLGNIEDRELIEHEYAIAKIFLFTSRWESYGIALAEALSKGCFIVSTELKSLIDILEGNEYAYIFPIDDVAAGAQCLEKACGRKEEESKKRCESSQLFAKEKFSWDIIARKIVSELED